MLKTSIIKKNNNKLTLEFLKKYNLKNLISSTDTDRILTSNHLLNNSHIFVSWQDFIFDNEKNLSCPIKPCLDCPTRTAHQNYAASKFKINSKKSFFKNKYDSRWNIWRYVPEDKLKSLFEVFILNLLNEPKSTGSKRSPNSIHTYISQIRKGEKDLNRITGNITNLTNNIENKISANTSGIDILGPEILNKITDCILNESIWRNILIHSRVKGMFFIMIQTGMRQSEIINLNKVDYENGKLRIYSNKNKNRRIALNENSIKVLEQYLDLRFDNNEALFINQDFQRITKSSVENAWKRVSEKINIHFSSMDLRRTSAVLFAKSGTSPEELKELYGFRTKQIATKYFREGVERKLLEKQMKFNPLNI